MFRVPRSDVPRFCYWLELLVDADIVPQSKLADLMKECDEITAIVVASINTAKRTRTH